MTGEQQSFTVVLHSYIVQNYNLQYVCWSFVALAITVFLFCNIVSVERKAYAAGDERICAPKVGIANVEPCQ